MLINYLNSFGGSAVDLILIQLIRGVKMLFGIPTFFFLFTALNNKLIYVHFKLTSNQFQIFIFCICYFLRGRINKISLSNHTKRTDS